MAKMKVKYGVWMVMVVSTVIFSNLKVLNKKALKQLNWNQFLRESKCIKQWTNDNGPVSLLLNEKKVKLNLKQLKPKPKQLIHTT